MNNTPDINNDRRRDAMTRAIVHTINLRCEPGMTDLDLTDISVAADALNRIRARFDQG